MIRLGILGLDTSHAAAFAEILDGQPDVDITHVWDGGQVRSDADVEAFCERYAATRVESPRAVNEAVDAGLILTVDWSTHVPIALEFVRAGRPVLIDKPIAGSARDLECLRAALDGSPATIFGGSAVPFHPAVAGLPRRIPGRTTFAAGYNDPFYYGAHLTDTLRRVTGTDWTRVRPLECVPGGVSVTFDAGTTGILRLDGPSADAAFGILDVGDRTRTVRLGGDQAVLKRMYAPFLAAFLETIDGARDDRETILDAASLLLAVHCALRDGVPVEPDDAGLRSVEVDPAPFLEGYQPYE